MKFVLHPSLTDLIVSCHTIIIKLHFACFRPGRKIGELHVVLGLEDLGPVNLQRLMGANEVSWRGGRDNCSVLNIEFDQTCCRGELASQGGAN